MPDDILKAQSMMTQFDFEASILRTDNLVHHWPFTEPESTRYEPATPEALLAMKYLRQEVTWEQAHYQLAEKYNAERRYEEAAREYLALAKVLGFDYHPLMLAGDVNMNMNQKIAAEGFYRRALALSANKFVYERLGTLFKEGGRADSAVIFYRCALKADAEAGGNGRSKWNVDVMQRLAEAYAACGDSSNAYREAMSLLAVDPANGPAKKILSGLLLK
jgi:tetratricopeptide (TPR) repeat protein